MFDGVKVRFSLVFYIVVVKQGGTERHTGSLVHNRLCVYQSLLLVHKPWNKLLMAIQCSSN